MVKLRTVELLTRATFSRSSNVNSILRHVVGMQIEKFAITESWIHKTFNKAQRKEISCNDSVSYFVWKGLSTFITVNVFLQIWCWSCHNGAALLKMSAFPKEQDDSTSQMQKAFLDGSVIAILSTTLCLVWTLLLFFHICYIFKLARIRLELKVIYCCEMGLSPFLIASLVSCAGL